MPWRAASLAVALLCAAPAWGDGLQANAPPPATGQISERDVAVALEKVRADPNLAARRTISTLHWVDSKKERKPTPGWVHWIGELFSWLAHNGRFLFWGVLAVLAVMLVVYLMRLIRAHGMPERSRRFEAPSFVRDLDIRPESLPADIGAAARKLWDGGEHRAALALLYRGLLSRLVHVHGVPIRDSSTEGDCLSLVTAHFADEERRLYVTDLVRIWQRAVYGGATIPTESVHALCDEFARTLDTPAAAGAPLAPSAAGLST